MGNTFYVKIKEARLRKHVHKQLSQTGSESRGGDISESSDTTLSVVQTFKY